MQSVECPGLALVPVSLTYNLGFRVQGIVFRVQSPLGLRLSAWIGV